MISRERIFTLVLLLAIPFFGYYSIRNFDFGFIYSINLEIFVGIVAILSGLTGIIMGFASTRQASLDAVKEYYQQGDSKDYKDARKYIMEHDELKGVTDLEKVSDIVNFYELWGLLNKKNYLPIWVFGGVSGIRVVEMYMKLTPIIITVRDGTIDSHKPINPFYAKNFEELSYRIYRKYKKNFKLTNFNHKYRDEFVHFTKMAYRK